MCVNGLIDINKKVMRTCKGRTTYYLYLNIMCNHTDANILNSVLSLKFGQGEDHKITQGKKLHQMNLLYCEHFMDDIP